MRALTVAPGIANSAGIEDVPDPPASDGAVLVRSLALGVCGTDREIVAGLYGWAPLGRERLVIGHESLGTVEEAPVNSGFKRGDLVAVLEIESDEAVCGFYDADFGIVCIEGIKGQPDLFDEKEVKILGKIVGVCDSGETEDGKLVVRTLSL